MLSKVSAGPYTVRGLSVGGIYTCLHVPELRLLLDAGLPPRSFAGPDTLLLSHGHVDHVGALASLLGLRCLSGKSAPLRVIMPAEIEAPLARALAAMTEMQRYELSIEAVPVMPGDVVPLHTDYHVRAFRTKHLVPSLGYQVFRRVKKLRAEFHELPGEEIGRRRLAGDDIFDEIESLELAYVTDTLIDAIDDEPSLYDSRVLILECTFLDDKKSRADSRAGCHVHLDEIVARADRFNNQHIVLMHFSQLYRPDEVVELLAARCPPSLHERILPLVPRRGAWPG
jgi:ribonuclease Z